MRWLASHRIIHPDIAFDLYARSRAHFDELVDLIRLNIAASIGEIDKSVPLTAISEVNHFSEAPYVYFHGTQVKRDRRAEGDRFSSPIFKTRAQRDASGGCQQAKLNVSAKAGTWGLYQTLFE
jgi:hypothetical protein